MTVMQQLGEILKPIPGMSVRYDHSEMLVKLPVGNGRSQVVRLMTGHGVHTNCHILKFQSRSGTINDAKMVRSAIRANAGTNWAGLVLETSVKPPVLDVSYGMVIDIDQLDVNAILAAIYEVAEYADLIEERLSGKDEF